MERSVFISIKLEETYLDNINGTLTVEIYKNWKDKFGTYTRLLASLPGIPYYQAKALYHTLETLKPQEIENNVLPFNKLTLVVNNG